VTLSFSRDCDVVAFAMTAKCPVQTPLAVPGDTYMIFVAKRLSAICSVSLTRAVFGGHERSLCEFWWGITLSKVTDHLEAHDLAQHGGLKADRSGSFVVAAISGIALMFSAFSLWETSLKSSDLQMFVPPVVYYAAPYNSNFEMINIPVTLVNEGAQTGTAQYFDLEVTNPKTKETKRFYSAQFGVWSMQRTQERAYAGFSPISLQGHSSRAESILFYTRGADEKPDRVISEAGTYQFKLTLVQAPVSGVLSGLFGVGAPISMTFERKLPFWDARAFQEGTIFMHSADWEASSRLPRVTAPDVAQPETKPEGEPPAAERSP
jgi:hypothetical protein